MPQTHLHTYAARTNAMANIVYAHSALRFQQCRKSLFWFPQSVYHYSLYIETCRMLIFILLIFRGFGNLNKVFVSIRSIIYVICASHRI